MFPINFRSNPKLTSMLEGILISVGIGSAAIRVVVAPVSVAAKTIRASLFSDTSISSTSYITYKNHKQKNHFCDISHR